jgi:hypothetical protein
VVILFYLFIAFTGNRAGAAATATGGAGCAGRGGAAAATATGGAGCAGREGGAGARGRGQKLFDNSLMVVDVSYVI